MINYIQSFLISIGLMAGEIVSKSEAVISAPQEIETCITDPTHSQSFKFLEGAWDAIKSIFAPIEEDNFLRSLWTNPNGPTVWNDDGSLVKGSRQTFYKVYDQEVYKEINEKIINITEQIRNDPKNQSLKKRQTSLNSMKEWFRLEREKFYQNKLLPEVQPKNTPYNAAVITDQDETKWRKEEGSSWLDSSLQKQWETIYMTLSGFNSLFDEINKKITYTKNALELETDKDVKNKLNQRKVTLKQLEAVIIQRWNELVKENLISKGDN